MIISRSNKSYHIVFHFFPDYDAYEILIHHFFIHFVFVLPMSEEDRSSGLLKLHRFTPLDPMFLMLEIM